MSTTLLSVLTIILPPITGIVTWIVSRRTRNNSTLQQMQQTIDMLVDRNMELTEQMISLNTEILNLRTEIETLTK